MTASAAETDPSVCYRHPDRTSWTLCSRCGRTICPECQILTPGGVRCPACVHEEGGSVQWTPTAQAPKKAKARARASRRPARQLAERVEASTLPVVTLGTVGIALVLWLIGFFTANLPFELLAALPEHAWQVWRLVTSGVAYPSGGGGVVFVILSLGIFTLISWNAERQFGRRRFLILLVFSTAGAAALSMLVGGGSFGLTGPIWGIAGAYLILVWDQPSQRNRILISIVIWFVLSLFLGGNIIAMIGGALSGIGLTLLLRRYEDRPSAHAGMPYFLAGGAILIVTVLAILRNVVVA